MDYWANQEAVTWFGMEERFGNFQIKFKSPYAEILEQVEEDQNNAIEDGSTDTIWGRKVL